MELHRLRFHPHAGRPGSLIGDTARDIQMSGTYAQDMRSAAADTPISDVAVFSAAVADFRAGTGQLGDGFDIENLSAPKKLAPFSDAVAVTVHRNGDEVASGRLILLYDPAGRDEWAGQFRLVAYVQAEVEPELAADPLLGEVGWSWLTEALEQCVPAYAAESGTVTREITEGFGGKDDEPVLTDFQLRASWSPLPADGDLDLASHVAAWGACIAAAAGLEPPGTSVLGRRR